MAGKRMFAKSIVESAKFLKMPSSSQNLYFHLGINADDDGIVEAYSVLNLIKANEDDLKILLGKGFIEILNEDLVAFIVDWRVNNYIRPDRKTDSIHKELLLSIRPKEQLVEKKDRSDVKKKSQQIKDKKSGPSTDGQWTEEGRVKEYSINKINLEENIAQLGNENLTINEYNELVQLYDKDLVDGVIDKILKHPYTNCLNVLTIAKWCDESKRRNNTNNKKNRFNNFNQRTYDFEELERELLSKSVIVGGCEDNVS